MRWPVLLVVIVPPVVLAALGATHPDHLGGDTADWWTTLHILLVPLFPLLGIGHWLLLRDHRGPVAWVARIAAFCYATFYGALDALAGIATGTIMRRSGVDDPADRPEITWLFSAGVDLGDIGARAFLVASVVTAVLLLRRGGPRAIPGCLVLVAASVSFLDSHIYWPRGVITMLGVAVGFGLLAVSERAAAASDSRART